jgi:hypothetical protein
MVHGDQRITQTDDRNAEFQRSQRRRAVTIWQTKYRDGFMPSGACLKRYRDWQMNIIAVQDSCFLRSNPEIGGA